MKNCISDFQPLHLIIYFIIEESGSVDAFFFDPIRRIKVREGVANSSSTSPIRKPFVQELNPTS